MTRQRYHDNGHTEHVSTDDHHEQNIVCIKVTFLIASIEQMLASPRNIHTFPDLPRIFQMYNPWQTSRSAYSSYFGHFRNTKKCFAFSQTLDSNLNQVNFIQIALL